MSDPSPERPERPERLPRSHFMYFQAITKRWIEDPGRTYFASLANQISRGSEAGRHAASQPSL